MYFIIRHFKDKSVIKAEFSASLLQSSRLHGPSEINLITFGVQETFLIIINIENSYAASYLHENEIHFFRI